jgi:hypothetical protein
LPTDSAATVDAITRAYVKAAGGDPLAALRLAVADALYTLAEIENGPRSPLDGASLRRHVPVTRGAGA